MNSTWSRALTDRSKLLTALSILLLLLFSAIGTAIKAENTAGYQVFHFNGKVLVSFSQQFAFDEISLPTISAELWGKGNRCKAALLEASEQQYIAAGQDREQFILFKPNHLASSSLLITPLIVASQSIETSPKAVEARIKFIAVPAEYRYLENRLATLAEKVSNFQQKNQCFSCHTALPLALTFQAASNRGFNIDQNLILQIGREIAGMQQSDGSYFFRHEPTYGTTMTTLCAGATMAIISDFSAEFSFNLKKILPLLNEWKSRDGITDSDFFFRPLFVGQPTAAVLEAIIIGSLYFKHLQYPDYQPAENLHKRLLELQNWVATQKTEAVYRRIVIMAAIPLLFQFDHTERELIIRELTGVITNEPEGKRRDVRALIFAQLKRIAPDLNLQLPEPPQPQSIADEIWDCHEKIQRLPVLGR